MYAIAQGAVELPWALGQAIVYSVITYFMIYFEMNAGKRPSLSLSRLRRIHEWSCLVLSCPFHPMLASCIDMGLVVQLSRVAWSQLSMG